MSEDRRFEELYREHAIDVLGYCARRTSREEARDAAADVFVVALRRIHDIPRGEAALPWLYVVARNVLKNRRRAQRRRTRLGTKLAVTSDMVSPGPEPQVVRNEEYQLLLDAMERLPDMDREIIRLIEWEGLNREIVADMFFVSRGAIDQRMSRAYRRLGRSLGHAPSEPRTAPVPAEEGGEA